MYETEGIDGLVCKSPNETILFNDENDLNKFMNLLKNNNFESLKQLGDLMIIRKCFDKSIYYYESVLKLKNDNLLIKSKILSNLSENYIQYKYYSKGLEFINKSFDIINIILKNNVEQIDQKFLIKLFFRKLRCFIGLRNFKEAFDYLEKLKNDQDLKNFYKLDESFIKEFLNNNEIKNLTKMINKGYENFLGNYNIEEMLIEEKNNFFLNNGDYINKKLEISFDNKKGIKIIAKKDINIGEYIIVEKAIYICRTHDPNNDFESSIKIKYPFHIISQIEYIDCLNNLIKILKKSPLDYKEFFVLFNGNNLKQNYEERIKNLPEDLLSIFNIELIENIFKINKFITLRQFYYNNKIGIGLWKFLSLFNHSCLPNTTNLGIGDFIIVTANKQIKKGEEITISYLKIPIYNLNNVRKNLIKNIYNFDCNCLLCEIEKKSKEKYPEIFNQYCDFILKIRESDKLDYKICIKDIENFALFLDKNKNIFSDIEIGRAYLEIQTRCKDIFNATRFYNLANKYLKDNDVECLKININTYLDFCKDLYDQKLINFENCDNAKKDIINFYRKYFNLKENVINLLLKMNFEERINENIIIENEREFNRLYKEKLKKENK